MHITVTSTALDPGEIYIMRCRDSVRKQRFKNFHHVYFDAHEKHRGMISNAPQLTYHTIHSSKGVFDNLMPLWRSLPDDEIIVWLDGDDWLATEYALDHVAKAHKQGALVTYGSFMYPDGRMGFAAPSSTGYPRQHPWIFTHLKTFRAGLVKQIRDEELKIDGKYSNLVTDQAIMLPCLEMAGPDRSAFIPEIVYVYNSDHSMQKNSPDEQEFLTREHAEVRRIRALQPYKRIPWPPTA
jgi:hypothetical protein